MQEAIRTKAGLLRIYLEACDECWLLLVADSFKASGNLDFSEESQMQTFSSPFRAPTPSIGDDLAFIASKQKVLNLTRSLGVYELHPVSPGHRR